jgi:hypothetical protein
MSWAQVPTLKRNQQGQVFVNPEKDYLRPYELSPDKPNQIVQAAALGVVGPFPLTAKHDGPIECFYQKVVVYDENDVVLTNYNIDFQLSFPTKRKIFSNAPIPLIACAGDGGRPYVLPETIFLPAVSALQITFYNRDNAIRKIEFVIGGIKYYINSAPQKTRGELSNYQLRREATYTYWMTTNEAVILAASETDADFFMTIPDDTDLEVLKLTAQSTGTFRCLIKDSENDRAVTNGEKMHSSILFGGHVATALGGGVGGSGGVYPARWATSFLARRSTQIQLIFDDLTAAENTVKVVFGGRKIASAS